MGEGEKVKGRGMRREEQEVVHLTLIMQTHIPLT